MNANEFLNGEEVVGDGGFGGVQFDERGDLLAHAALDQFAETWEAELFR